MILHSQIIGEGKPFIILHGFLGMSDNWKTLGKQFSELGYQMHLIDQRNHGKSFHDDEFNYAVLAEDVQLYCKEHQVEDITLLGHSMGGKTAMQLATQQPTLVQRLIIADIGPKEYPSHHQDILKALSTLDFEAISSRGEAEDALSLYIKDVGTRLFLLKNLYWKEKGRLALRVNLKVVSNKINEIGMPLLAGALYEGPTLFVSGGNSGYIESRDEIGILMHFPKAKFEIVENAGHWLHAENPMRFHEIIAKFLLNTA